MRALISYDKLYKALSSRVSFDYQADQKTWLE